MGQLVGRLLGCKEERVIVRFMFTVGGDGERKAGGSKAMCLRTQSAREGRELGRQERGAGSEDGSQKRRGQPEASLGCVD